MATNKPVGMTRGVLGSDATNRKLTELDTRMLSLKREFDQYFNGIDRLPPLLHFENLKRDVRALTSTNYATAVLRFKVQNFNS